MIRLKYYLCCRGTAKLDEIPAHRAIKDGYAYWLVRVHYDDARARGIRHGDLVKLYNDRGAVLAVACLTERMKPGVIMSYQAGAKYDPLEPGKPGSIDRGGCVNLPRRPGWFQRTRREYKREDGIDIVDLDKAAGQKQIVNTCPNSMIYWNEEKQLLQKCDLCAHFLDQGFEKPRCVEMRPTGALIFGGLSDPDSEISKLVAENKPCQEHPEYGLDSNVLYLNVSRKFVTGTLVFKDTDQCAGASRSLSRGTAPSFAPRHSYSETSGLRVWKT